MFLYTLPYHPAYSIAFVWTIQSHLFVKFFLLKARTVLSPQMKKKFLCGVHRIIIIACKLIVSDAVLSGSFLVSSGAGINRIILCCPIERSCFNIKTEIKKLNGIGVKTIIFLQLHMVVLPVSVD